MILLTLYRTLLRGSSSRARVIGFAAMSVVGVVIAIVLRGSDVRDPTFVGIQLVDKYGLTLLIPLAALVFGTAALGDPIEDGTYVYLWMRPYHRGQLTLAAFMATTSLVFPLAVVPTIGAAMIVDSSPQMFAGAVLSTAIAGMAYSAVFVFLGQCTQRALIWGVAYLLILEEFISRGGSGLGFISVHSHAVSVLAKSLGESISLDYFSRPVGLVVPVVFTALLLGWSTARQRSMNVA